MEKVLVKLTVSRTDAARGQEIEVGLAEALRLLDGNQIERPSKAVLVKVEKLRAQLAAEEDALRAGQEEDLDQEYPELAKAKEEIADLVGQLAKAKEDLAAKGKALTDAGTQIEDLQAQLVAKVDPAPADKDKADGGASAPGAKA
jgi:septal ring factor EnvC (AmiA/AmiB activator)